MPSTGESRDRFKKQFSRIGDAFEITSEATPTYNCIAWAIGETERWWEGGEFSGYYWPSDVPTSHALDSLELALRKIGFERSEVGAFDSRYETIAIFEESDEEYSHVAKALANGHWSSKIGDAEDIEHYELEALVGQRPAYGRFAFFMRRLVSEIPGSL